MSHPRHLPGKAISTAAGNGALRFPLTVGLLLVLTTACDKKTPPTSDSTNTVAPSSPWFASSETEPLLEFQHHSGHQDEFLFPEIMSGGVACLDYDNDGWWDLYLIQGGSLKPEGRLQPTNQLYRNRGDGTFENVTAQAAVGDAGYGMGVVCGDYDNDGDTDIYVTNVGRNVLYRNLGNGQFEDTSSDAGVDHPGWGTSASFLDYDHDGDLDLFVTNYIRWSVESETNCYSRGGKPDYCSPLSYKAPAKDVLYRNDGNGRFTDVTAEAGITQAFGNGLGVACADFDQDGWVDIFVANDAMPNQLWLNQMNGTFKNDALLRGCAVNGMGLNEAGMGVGLLDVNEDGWVDLFLTHLENESNTLYMNANGYFRDEVQKQGPGVQSWPFTGFGLAVGDFNNDGIQDIYVANGRVKYGPKTYNDTDLYAEPNQLLKGLGKGKFSDFNHAIPNDSRLPKTSRATIQVDLNNDGGLDLVTVNRDGPAVALINQLPNPNSHWIRFRLLNKAGSDAIGARITVAIGGQTRSRLVQTGLGYCSSQDPRIHLGLGTETQVAEVSITWPDRSVTTHGPYQSNQFHVIRQP